jgi:hypothetical protein
MVESAMAMIAAIDHARSDDETVRIDKSLI